MVSPIVDDGLEHDPVAGKEMWAAAESGHHGVEVRVAVEPNLLLRYASLRREDRDALFEQARRNPSVVNLDEAHLNAILDQVADDRLDFADRRAALAQGVLDAKPGGEEAARRDAMVAAYDAIHHGLRALHIAFRRWDPIGHGETLDATGELLGDNGELAKRFDFLKLGRPLQDVVRDLQTQRQAAEWDIYNRTEDGKPRVDYAAQAPVAVKLAADALRAIRLAFYDHRSGEL